MDAPVVYMALKYNRDLPCVMSFYLVPHLPRLVALAARFLGMMKENIVNCFIFISFLLTTLVYDPWLGTQFAKVDRLGT